MKKVHQRLHTVFWLKPNIFNKNLSCNVLQTQIIQIVSLVCMYLISQNNPSELADGLIALFLLFF